MPLEGVTDSSYEFSLVEATDAPSASLHFNIYFDNNNIIILLITIMIMIIIIITLFYENIILQ